MGSPTAVDDVSGKGPLPHWREKNRAVAEAPDRQMARPRGSRLARALPPAPAPDSYPECRAVLTLIAATNWTVDSSAALVIPTDHSTMHHPNTAPLRICDR
jgi:hypothetical protein